MADDERDPDLSFETTAERSLILVELTAIEHSSMRLGGVVTNARNRDRIQDLAQIVAARKSLLIRDWHDADAAAGGGGGSG